MLLFAAVIALCFIASFRLVNIQSTVMLLIFNGLFVSLAFQLNGVLLALYLQLFYDHRNSIFR